MTVPSVSIGVRNLQIDELISASDVIVVADVTDVMASGRGKPIVFQDQLLQSAAYVGNLAVKRTIRGSAPEHIIVRYDLPLSFIGYQGLRTGVRLVFLRKEKAGFSLADPYYPDFPALPTLAGIEERLHAGGDYKTATLGEMLAVIASSNTSSAEKSEILRVDYALPHNKDVIAALKEGLSSVHDPELRQRIQGELLRFGDVSELPDVVNLLLANLATENQRIWLLYVIGNRVSDAHAIPALQPLVASEESSIREAAVEALWHIADPNRGTPALEEFERHRRAGAILCSSSLLRHCQRTGMGRSQRIAIPPTSARVFGALAELGQRQGTVASHAPVPGFAIPFLLTGIGND